MRKGFVFVMFVMFVALSLLLPSGAVFAQGGTENGVLTTSLIQYLIAAIATIGVAGVVIVLIQRHGLKGAASFLKDVNANAGILNAIEYAGKNVDPTIALSALDTLKMATKANADLVAAITELQTTIRLVTDGLPNANGPVIGAPDEALG